MINILLSGGSGTRLWPLSRTMLPKQFVRLFAQRSLFQHTLERNKPLIQKTLIVANIEHYFLALDQCSELAISAPHFLLEPIGRNTAPALALACFALDEEDIVLVTTSDHLIRDQSAYQQAVKTAQELAHANYLVTFGITPHYPETGFGYIQAAGQDVLSFTEKPDVATAEQYIKQGQYYWNSGIFCFKVGVFLEELKKYAPDIHDASYMAYANRQQHESIVSILTEDMLHIPENSIDYAVMEKSDKVKVVPCDMGWSDLGSFDALFDELKTPEQKNAILPRQAAAPDPICLDAQDNLLITRDRQVALIDVSDLLVIDTTDALLIAKRGSAQKVKQVVTTVKATHPALTETHHEVHRPWGSYEVSIHAKQYKVKRIVVKPQAQLSLQKHLHRNEHWIVVSGTATVTVEDRTFLLRPNESTYIEMGQVHRLSNQGKIDLVMIEVQSGEYLGEDDIVRFEDQYGRPVL